METLADEIARVSGGDVTFDARSQRLRQHLPGRRQLDHPMTETELRHWLQRLLFSSDRSPAEGTDSRQLSIELLVETLDAERRAA